MNWCQRDTQGFGKLDAFYDTNERRYFITPESVNLAIAEEQAKAAKHSEGVEPVASVPKDSERRREDETRSTEANSESVRAFEKELMDLKILNGGKDFLIEQLRKERDKFIEQIVSGSRKIGQLETELRQLSAPRKDLETATRNSEGTQRENSQ